MGLVIGPITSFDCLPGEANSKVTPGTVHNPHAGDHTEREQGLERGMSYFTTSARPGGTAIAAPVSCGRSAEKGVGGSEKGSL